MTKIILNKPAGDHKDEVSVVYQVNQPQAEPKIDNVLLSFKKTQCGSHPELDLTDHVAMKTIKTSLNVHRMPIKTLNTSVLFKMPSYIEPLIQLINTCICILFRYECSWLKLNTFCTYYSK